MLHRIIGILWRIVPGLVLGLVTFAYVQAQGSDGVLRVVATVPELGSLARAVGGEQVVVTVLVKGTEELRTTVNTAIQLEKSVRGTTAGFNTPTFVVDAPGGGGKRDVHSHVHYDRSTGISVYTAPRVKPGQYFLYFDPVDRLPAEGQARWADPAEHARMCDEAIAAARAFDSATDL